MNHFKKLLLCIVFYGFSHAHAGSYEDFFQALDKDNGVIVGALLERGFDPNSFSPRGLPALCEAIKKEAFDVALALARHPATDVDARTPQDESPLMLAALKGHLELVRLLLDRGADVNKPGWTPLHYAATGGGAELIELLLARHAYIDAESPNQSTPLMMAAMYGGPDSVQVLLDAGADPTIKNNLGLTAVDFALKSRNQVAADLIAAAVRARKPQAGW